jgi:hypothetical protein
MSTSTEVNIRCQNESEFQPFPAVFARVPIPAALRLETERKLVHLGANARLVFWPSQFRNLRVPGTLNSQSDLGSCPAHVALGGPSEKSTGTEILTTN